MSCELGLPSQSTIEIIRHLKGLTVDDEEGLLIFL